MKFQLMLSMMLTKPINLSNINQFLESERLYFCILGMQKHEM